jgi:hypothetical protein
MTRPSTPKARPKPRVLRQIAWTCRVGIVPIPSLVRASKRLAEKARLEHFGPYRDHLYPIVRVALVPEIRPTARRGKR